MLPHVSSDLMAVVTYSYCISSVNTPLRYKQVVLNLINCLEKCPSSCNVSDVVTSFL